MLLLFCGGCTLELGKDSSLQASQDGAVDSPPDLAPDLGGPARVTCAISRTPTVLLRQGFSPVLSGDHCFLLYQSASDPLREVSTDGKSDKLVTLMQPFATCDRRLVSHDGNSIAVRTAADVWLHRFGGGSVKMWDGGALGSGIFSLDDSHAAAVNGDLGAFHYFEGSATRPFESVAAGVHPWFSANADNSLFVVAGDSAAGTGALIQVFADGSSAMRMASLYLDPAPSPGGTFALALQGKGVSTLTYVPLAGAKTTPWATLLLPLAPIASPTGNRVAVVTGNPPDALTVWDSPGAGIAIARQSSGNVVWSDDGNRLLYDACNLAGPCFAVHDFALGKDFALGSIDRAEPTIEGLTSDGKYALVGAPPRIVEVDTAKVLYAAPPDGNEQRSPGRLAGGAQLYWVETVAGKRVVKVFDERTKTVYADPTPADPYDFNKAVGLSVLGDGVGSLLYVAVSGGKHLLRTFVVATHGFETLADDLPSATVDISPDRAAAAWVNVAGGIEIAGLP